MKKLLRTLALRTGLGLGASALAGGACNNSTEPLSTATSVQISPSAGLITAVGDTLQFTALVRDGNGGILSAPFLVWRSEDRDVATVDPNTGLATSRAAGVTSIKGTSGSAEGTASLEVYIDPNTSFTAGQTYLGRNGYTEYVAGDLPVIIAVPRGGDGVPDEIDDRTIGRVEREDGTAEMGLALAAAIAQQTGGTPHLITSRLHTDKLDPDATQSDGAQGDPFGDQAWREYHGFISESKRAVNASFSGGMFVEIRGHAHPTARIELGYLITGSALAGSDTELSVPLIVNGSSVRDLAQTSGVSFGELVRGQSSIGGLLDAGGYAAVPSPSQHDPGGQPYFTGGYSLGQHGSRDFGTVSGVTISTPLTGIRDTDQNRQQFAAALTTSLGGFLLTHFGIDWTSP
jgi:hypothetical protein